MRESQNSSGQRETEFAEKLKQHSDEIRAIVSAYYAPNLLEDERTQQSKTLIEMIRAEGQSITLGQTKL